MPQQLLPKSFSIVGKPPRTGKRSSNEKSQELSANKQKKAIAVILRQIADKIEHGNSIMKQGTGTFVVDFLEDMTLEIKVKEEKKQRVKCSINLEFFVDYHGQDSIAIG